MLWLRSLKFNQPLWKRDVLFLTLVLGGLFFILLGSRPLFVPDEGRYAEIAREMVAFNDYITPYLNHIKYFEKPILFYWLEAAVIKIAGLHIWSLRSVNAFLGLLACILTYGFARKFYGRLTGILAALILGTSTLYFVMARMITLDLPVTVFLMICLYAFLLGVHEKPGHTRRFYLWGAATFAAFAVLTKGLIGIVFPILIISSWLTLTGQWRILKSLYIPSCLFIFLAITLPWHILVNARNPGFFYFYFINQHFLRYTNKHIGHYQPSWFFIPYFIIGFFPWIAFLPQSIARFLKWKNRHIFQTEIFLLLWAVIIFAFFSFSKSKLIPYILPVFPPLAILVARYLQQSIECQWNKGIKIGSLGIFFFSIFLVAIFYLFLTQSSLPDPKKASLILYSALSILIMGSSLTCFYVFRRRLDAGLITLIITAWLFLLTTFTAFPAIDKRTILPLANIVKPMLTAESEIITFNKYYQDLPFYLTRRVSVLNWRNELTYGMQLEPTHEWMIDNYTFWQRWHSQKRVFAIIGLGEYHHLIQKYPQEKIILLGKTIENALISNQK